MSENKLGALERASKQALDHVELVALARSQSPSQAWKLARSAGWPNRQADSCRSLARLRRDHGQEAFDSLIETTERARVGQPAAEQVRDNRRNDVDERIMKSLDRVTDPVAKLRLAVKHGLKGQAKVIFSGLNKTFRSFFWSDCEAKEVLFDTLSDINRPRGMIRMSDEETVTKVVAHQDRIVLAFSRPGEEVAALVVDFEGARSYFGFTKEETADTIRCTLENTVAQKPGRGNWRLFRPTATICRKYLRDSEPLAVQTELWLLQSLFRQGRLFELRQTALPVPIKEHPNSEAEELNPIVDRFMELGWTKEQVRAEFLDWIRSHVENCRPQWMLAVVGAKCFDWNDKERDSLLREKYWPGLWKDVKAGSGSFAVKMIVRFPGFADRDDERQFYQTEFVDMLSRGQLTRVNQLLLILGHPRLFWAESEHNRFNDAAKYLGDILPEAFWKSYSEGRYGVAAAMVQQFGSDACFHKELIEKQVKAIYDPQLDDVDEKYSDVVELWYGGGSEKDFETGRGKEWQDAKVEIGNQSAQALVKAQAERKELISNVTQLALDLGQPIKFEDVLTYYVAPIWPEH